ncbi:DUF1771-domain-containing protein [Hypoxylon sp. EC38]|nr:DUF1771-domain-containing protein [Hypoxylon sp. EC38]
MAIPLTRLGDRAFNHSPNTDAEAEYDRLRELAREEAAKRNSCFDRAHQAYERGDGATAKELSNEGKRHAAKMAEYNKRASEFIFRENNAPGRVPDDTIDLHGQFVEEAEDILETHPGGYARPDHGGQPHHHGGQPQHHHHEPEEQPDELERLVGKFFRKLGDCCVVM